MGKEPTVNKYFVAIAGNIGAGKTTLTSKLSEQLDWEPFLEGVTDNPYLADFYDDMRSWSFHSQVYFLARRLRHHRQLLERPHSVIQDRTVYEDAEIFARNLYQRGDMQERDYDTYSELYGAVTSILPPPDLVIYLRSSVETLIERIHHRGRPYEQDIDPAYLERLNHLYETWFEHFTLCPVLAVPSDRLNFVSNGGHLDLITKKILERLRGKEVVTFQ
jgi:deoxyadenosine/deoxycytidine kinase